MPNGWLRIGTSEDLRELLGDPNKFKREAHKRVGSSDAVLHEVYFTSADNREAYVLAGIPESADLEEVARKLSENFDGAEVEILLTAEEFPAGGLAG
jgi:hypothetical protein